MRTPVVLKGYASHKNCNNTCVLITLCLRTAIKTLHTVSFNTIKSIQRCICKSWFNKMSIWHYHLKWSDRLNRKCWKHLSSIIQRVTSKIATTTAPAKFHSPYSTSSRVLYYLNSTFGLNYPINCTLTEALWVKKSTVCWSSGKCFGYSGFSETSRFTPFPFASLFLYINFYWSLHPTHSAWILYFSLHFILSDSLI